MLTYIKTLATYISDLEATFFGFARGAEASALVLGKDLERFFIQTEAHSYLDFQFQTNGPGQGHLGLVINWRENSIIPGPKS